MVNPTAQLDPRYSDPTATAVEWDAARARLADAEVAWVVTVRPDGRPHATPLVAVAGDEKAYFHTGRHEVKAANLDGNPNVLLLAGDTAWTDGLDVMFEGVAAPVTDPAELRRVSDLFRRRWDGRWVLDVDGGVASAAAPDAEILVFGVTPTVVRAHAKGEPFGQTTYRFDSTEGSR